MSSQYLGDKESLSDLESRMPSPDRETYQSFRHLRIDSAFISRVYVIYKPTGLTKEGHHKAPEIVGQVKVVDWSCDIRKGCSMTIEDLGTGERMVVGHIPTRLFNYDIFVASPPFQRIRYDGRVVMGSVKRSLAFGILLKQRTRSDYYSAGASMIETLKGYRQLYPDYDLPFQYT